MGVIGGALGYRVLRRISRVGSAACSGAAYHGRSKVEALLGPGIWARIAGRVEEPVDVIVSLDAFEHFDDPPAALRHMASLLAPGGVVLAAFGPTWYHPYGGHLFSIFPWAHLLFTEGALLRWRADFKADGATRFREVEGGLNRMTIRRFERLVAASPLRCVRLEPVPIRGWRPLVRSRLTREAFSSMVRCELGPPPPHPAVAAPPAPVRDYGAR